MEILSKSQLKSIGDAYIKEHFNNSRKEFFDTVCNARDREDIRMFSLSRNDKRDKSVFLSHKHSDIEILKEAIALFKQIGVSVYIDWMDEDMPKHTSGETAKRIKEKIKENKKFVFLATENAINSKWCNWELGYGDSQKYIDHIAIFPIKDDDSKFTGNEYLNIYPVISQTRENSCFSFRCYTNYIVTFPNGEETRDLKQWLQS